MPGLTSHYMEMPRNTVSQVLSKIFSLDFVNSYKTVRELISELLKYILSNLLQNSFSIDATLCCSLTKTGLLHQLLEESSIYSIT
jgi:hypothetical protein